MNNKIDEFGFSLIELMVVLVIVTATLAGVVGGFRSFLSGNKDTMRSNEQLSDLKMTLQLLKRDLNMAGFGLATETRLAKDIHWSSVKESDISQDFDCDGDASTDSNVTENCLGYDLNNDGDTTDQVYRERLFIADGWEILRDITNNGEIDGDVVENPTDYFFKVADNKNKNDGYAAKLATDYASSSTAVQLVDLNLNPGEEYTTSTIEQRDFKYGKSLVLYGKNSAGQQHIQGLRTGSVDVSVKKINFLSGDALQNQFLASGSKVVPAIAWHVKDVVGEGPWLYRNRDRVLAGVVSFQATFGYDKKHDGIQWYETLPPPVGSPVDGNDSFSEKLKALKAVRVVLVIKSSSPGMNVAATNLKTYEKIVVLKN